MNPSLGNMGHIQSTVSTTDRAVAELPPVGEASGDDDEDNEIVDLSIDPTNAVKQQLNSELEHEAVPVSPNGHDVSGDTLLPGESGIEEDEIDYISMIESLPTLQTVSARILDFFATNCSSPSRSAELGQQLLQPRSFLSQKLQKLRDNLSSPLKTFTEATYIDVDQKKKTFPAVDHDSKTWRIDGLLYKSNCAQLGLQLFNPSEIEDALYDLENTFPSPFLHSFANEDLVKDAGLSSVLQPTLNLALDLRTQLLKLKLNSAAKGVDPNLVMQEMFYNTELDSQLSTSPPLSYRGFNLPAFQDSDGRLPDQYSQYVLERVRIVESCFQANGEVDLDALESKLPWEKFTSDVAQWLRRRNEELTRHLEQQPRVESILDQLEAAVLDQSQQQGMISDSQNPGDSNRASESFGLGLGQQQRKELLPAAEIEERYRVGGSDSFRGGLTTLLGLKKRMSSGNAVPSGSRASKLPSSTTGPRATLPATPISKLHRADISASSGTQLDAGNTGRQASQLAGRNVGQFRPAAQNRAQGRPSSTAQAFIDRQTTASRVSPIDSQRLGSSVAARATQKRAREEESDDDEDGAYESDDRSIDVQDRRAQKPTQVAKRARYNNTSSSQRQTVDSVAELAEGQNRQVVAVAAAAAAAPAPAVAPPKPAQIRRNWSTTEDKEFIRLIETYGTSWSHIKSQDELQNRVLLSRKQVDLKDRARNLVMIMLK